MKVNLTQIPSFWMTCPKTLDRWPKFEAMINSLGIPAQKINGEITSPYTLGVAASYLKVLRENLDNGPILFMEDDLVITKFEEEIHIPVSTDCIYLGTSHYGRRFGQTQIGGVICKDDLDWLRCFNMLSMHFFVVVSRKYKEHLISLLEKFDGNSGVDDGIADTMWDWKVFATKQPWGFQNDGHSAEPTRQPLQPIF